jgi:hypothetical protein
MKVNTTLTTGRWSVSTAMRETHPTECSDENLNQYPVLQLRHLHFYSANTCEGHEECENLSQALAAQGEQMASGGGDVDGNPIQQPIQVKKNNEPILIDPHHFLITRFDLNFDNELAGTVPAEVRPCYQGAQFSYDLQATAFQTDAPW